MTVRDDIAQIRQSVNILKPDSRLFNKFIYDKLLTTAKMIIRRDAENRRIFRATELFLPLHCIDMESVSTQSCTDILIPGCTTLSKSVKKLPEAFITPAGSILNIYAMDGVTAFNQTSPLIYSNTTSREFKVPVRYFWIENGYLYIPESITKVMGRGIFINSVEVDKFNKGVKTCTPFLDSNSFLPQWLREDIINVVINSIAGVTKRIPVDENTNLNANG